MDRITIDAEDLIMALQSNDFGFAHYLDSSTGEVVFLGDEDVVEEDAQLRSLLEDDPDRFVGIVPISSSESWQIMADFIEQLTPGVIAERLSDALRHRKPFRSFKDTLLNYPDLREDWFAFEFRRMLEIAREWLADVGIEAELKTRDLGKQGGRT
jgi:hypothetical protein